MISGFFGLLPHGAILICNMYIVFFLIDRVNSAMCFIDNEITKGLLLIMCVISMGTSVSLIRLKHREEAAKARRMKKKHLKHRKTEADNVIEYKKHAHARKKAA